MEGVNSQQEVVATEELDDAVGLAISGDDPVELADRIVDSISG